ncbi:MAG: pyrroloquinoline quinone biosynthesis peptide chaperone PqqD, partial [Candidatus Omnitrophica bacterium]|nr:pyrroloquinoline quinone biosynthesis peptide chaperone PqqD [Candidatus Omnitrophota bacterium]
MESKVSLENIYKPSEDIVARDIQGELIIIPITSGVADNEDEIFTLNETARAIWERLDGKKTLKEITQELSQDFEARPQEIEKDVLGLVEELLKRRMPV